MFYTFVVFPIYDTCLTQAANGNVLSTEKPKVCRMIMFKSSWCQ